MKVQIELDFKWEVGKYFPCHVVRCIYAHYLMSTP